MSTAEVPAELVQIFREEAAEHLDGMIACLLAVESGRASSEDTDTLFRHAHSIKGSAGMVGLPEAGAIANSIEDVLQSARDAGSLSPTLTEPLLQATDALRRAVAGERGVAPAAQRVAEHPTENGETPKEVARATTIRVAAHKVDRMLDAVGETVLHHRRLEHMLGHAVREGDEIMEGEVDRGERLLEELQHTVLDLRMVPLSTITSPLPRAVRDLATTEGKQVDLEITGADTQLDRVLLDGISEAINHLLRTPVLDKLRAQP